MKDGDSVLIIGGGIAGMRSALLLAEAGYKVHLLERAPALGGSMPLLDRTFPTDSCGLCFMSPERPAYCPFLECQRAPHIEILAYCQVEGLEGEPGDFQVSILEKARYVDQERCTGCGDCVSVCPVEVPRELGEGLERRKAIYIPYPQAIPNAYLIDREACTECGECVRACPQGAVDLGMEDKKRVVEVGAVILAPGFHPFPAARRGEFGFGIYENVLTGFQFERMLSLTSPTKGLPRRPSDGAMPQRIAFIQCVGSRDCAHGQPYCSSVCCMYATKQAMLAKERAPHLEIEVFYMDLRTYGKGYDRYLEQAKKGYGIRYRRSTVSAVKEEPQSGNLLLSFVGEDGRPQRREFDLVVLSTGFRPPEGGEELARRLGIELNDYGFPWSGEFSPSHTSRPGVFIAGAFREPKDIVDSVAEAASAATSAARLLERGEEGSTKEYPPEREISEEEPRIGVFICRCGEEIAGALDLDRVKEEVGRLKDVASIAILPYACREEGRQEIKGTIAREALNRVVVGGCTHRLYDSLLQEALREAGLNPYLLERADLREGCAWPHRGEGRATDKAQALLEAAVGRARLLKPLQRSTQGIDPHVLVLGGGLAGLTASLALADLGFSVHLVEREDEFGGNLRKVYYTLRGSDPQGFLRTLLAQVESHPRIAIHKGAELVGFQGSVGQFRSNILAGGQEVVVEHGATIVATGGEVVVPTDYLYGQDPRVIIQRELEARIVSSQPLGDSLVMIQCVGSREEGRLYCSRICCSQALKNALRLKELKPETDIFILYRDMMSYGFKEEYYRQAREAGVVFIPYEPEGKPQLFSAAGGLRVEIFDPLLGQKLILEPDMVVLSPGVVPKGNGELARLLNIPLDEDGFFKEANPKVAPTDSGRPGVFICGLAQGPRSIEESISQANGVAIQVAALLSKERLVGKAATPTVNERLCSGCGLCVSLCPHDARIIDEERRVAEVIDILCQGCGICAMACPNGATQQNLYEMRQVMAMMDALA